MPELISHLAALLWGSLRGSLWRRVSPSHTTAGLVRKVRVAALPLLLSGCSGPLSLGALDPDCDPPTLPGPPPSGPGRGGGGRCHGDVEGHVVRGGSHSAALQALQLTRTLPAGNVCRA